MNKGIIIGIVVIAAIVGGILISPLFYSTEVDEPLPTALNKIESGLTLSKFSNMNDTIRQDLVKKMSDDLKDMIMDETAKTPRIISETMDMGNDQNILIKSGTFVGLAGHQAKGLAKIIQVEDSSFLRFEDFEVTNGPDLRVYLTPNGDVKNGIHLEKLKGSKGNQNYSIDNIDITQYNVIVIYCQPFGVYFASADLT